MNNKCFKLTLIIAINAIVFNACENKDIIELSNKTEKLIAKNTYFLDDKQVEEGTFNEYDTTLYIIKVFKPADKLKNSLEQVSETYAYSTEDKYIAFGEKHGYNFKGQLAFEEIMRTYAEKSGAIAEYEQTGKVPDWYLIYQNHIYDSIFNVTNLKSTTGSLFVMLFKDFNAQGNNIGMVSAFPAMPPGFNNCISSVEFVGLGAGINIFDKAFFFNKLQTIISEGMTVINLPSNSNNKMSSCNRFL